MSLDDDPIIAPQIDLSHIIDEALNIIGVRDYWETTDDQIQAAAKVFYFLGFVVTDKESSFGYKPTECLMRILAGKPKRLLRSRKADWDFLDLHLLESILQAALTAGCFQQNHRLFVFDVLGGLGLIRYTTRGGEIPTPYLREIASRCLYEKAVSVAQRLEF
jgi:hypothetical protein